MRLPGGDLPARISDRLHALDYTVGGVRQLLGSVASEALERHETVPALRVLKGDQSPMALAVRSFLLADPLSESEFSNLADELSLQSADVAGWVTVEGGLIRSSVEVAPYAFDDRDWLIASDWSARQTGHATAREHVLGVGGASTMLAQSTVRPPVERALDLGTGCGVQALHLAEHSHHVMATDISERCLDVARFNVALNGLAVELRQGSLFAPVAGDQFDLIVSNPPFVIGSPVAYRRDYRDFALPRPDGAGDAVCAELVGQAQNHLREQGWCQLLANWEITDGDDWSAHPRGWLADSRLDAWVIQREVQDPASYVEMWLRDAGMDRDENYRAVYDEWLTSLETRGVLGIGFGLISMRRMDRREPVRRFQHVPQGWHQPIGAEIERWFAVRDLLLADPSSVLRSPLSVSADVVLEQHRLGDEPLLFVRRTGGMAWSGPIDEFGAAALAALDGVQTAADAVLQAAEQLEVAPERALSQAIPVLGSLLEEGFVLGAP